MIEPFPIIWKNDKKKMNKPVSLTLLLAAMKHSPFFNETIHWMNSENYRCYFKQAQIHFFTDCVYLANYLERTPIMDHKFSRFHQTLKKVIRCGGNTEQLDQYMGILLNFRLEHCKYLNPIGAVESITDDFEDYPEDIEEITPVLGNDS